MRGRSSSPSRVIALAAIVCVDRAAGAAQARVVDRRLRRWCSTSWSTSAANWLVDQSRCRASPRAAPPRWSRRRPRSPRGTPSPRLTMRCSPSGRTATSTRVAVVDLAAEQRPRELVVDLVLHEPPQRTRAVDRVVAALGQPRPRLGVTASSRRRSPRRRVEPVDVELHDLAEVVGRQRARRSRCRRAGSRTRA